MIQDINGVQQKTSTQQSSEYKRAVRAKFYRNGDQFFKGVIYAVSFERFRMLDSLLAELTNSPVCDKNVLPNGVRYIFSLDSGEKITSLEQFIDGGNYVCSSSDSYKKLCYTDSATPSWNPNIRHHVNDASARMGTFRSTQAEIRELIQPRRITVLRNGARPRRAAQILLNHRTAKSFDQVMSDVTSSVKMHTGAVKKLFRLNGVQVTALADFFSDDVIFIAYGPERVNPEDFQLHESELQHIPQQQCDVTGAQKSVQRGSIASIKSQHRNIAINSAPCSPMTNRKHNARKTTNAEPHVNNGESARGEQHVKNGESAHVEQHVKNGESSHHLNGVSNGNHCEGKLSED